MFFHEIKVGNVNRSKPFQCEIEHGSWSMHQIRSILIESLPFANIDALPSHGVKPT